MSELPDRGWAAFTEQGPWSLVRDDIRWMPIAGQLRAAAQAEVPVLTRERKVPPGRRVLAVVRTLGGAVVPWLIAKRRRRFPHRSHRPRQ